MKLSRDKFLALLVCLCLIVTSLLSMSLLLLHTGHSCKTVHQDDCALCACVELSRSLLKYSGAALFLATAAWLLLLRRSMALAVKERLLCFATPVALCVRINR